MQVLREPFDLDAEMIRNEIIRMLSGPGRRQEPMYSDAEVEAVRAVKEAAIDAGDFERPASLRDKERRLIEQRGGIQLHTIDPLPRRLVWRRLVWAQWPSMLSGAFLLALGILVGRLIWG